MNITSFDKVRLERGGVILNGSPTIDDIMSAMQVAYDENGMEGPPELALVFGDNYPSALTTIRIPGVAEGNFLLPGGGQNGRRP